MTTPKTRVLCVDDSEDIAGLYSRLIHAEPDLESVGTLRCADELVTEVERLLPDVILLDLTMPGKDPLVALAELTHRSGITARTIVFSGYDDPNTADRAAAAGAWGLVSKFQDPSAVLDAIRRVAGGDVCFSTRGVAGR